MRRPIILTLPDPDHGCWPMAELTRFAAQIQNVDPAHDGAVVIQSAGRDFCRGVDLDLFTGDLPPLEHALHDAFTALADCPVPIVASVRGAASGFGLTMLTHASYVMASPCAVFSAPFLSLGLAPEAGSTLLLPHRIGPMAAFRLLVAGDTMTADEALSLGLISRIEDDPDTQARLIGRRLSRVDRELLDQTQSLLSEPNTTIGARIDDELAISRKRLETNDQMAITFERLARIADRPGSARASA